MTERATSDADCVATAADEQAGNAEPQRIESISTLAEAERYLRADGWSKTRARAFVARLQAVSAMRDLALTLERARKALLKE